MSLVVVGCSVDVDIVLFNTTGEVIVVEVADEQLQVAPLDSVSFKASDLYSGRVIVIAEKIAHHYHIEAALQLPSSYYRSGGWAADVWAHLDPEFRIHLIPASQSAVGEPVAPQPNGFPLVPTPTPRHAAQQAVAADAQQLVPIDPWYRSSGGRRAPALAVSAVGRS